MKHENQQQDAQSDDGGDRSSTEPCKAALYSTEHFKIRLGSIPPKAAHSVSEILHMDRATGIVVLCYPRSALSYRLM